MLPEIHGPIHIPTCVERQRTIFSWIWDTCFGDYVSVVTWERRVLYHFLVPILQKDKTFFSPTLERGGLAFCICLLNRRETLVSNSGEVLYFISPLKRKPLRQIILLYPPFFFYSSYTRLVRETTMRTFHLLTPVGNTSYMFLYVYIKYPVYIYEYLFFQFFQC